MRFARRHQDRALPLSERALLPLIPAIGPDIVVRDPALSGLVQLGAECYMSRQAASFGTLVLTAQ
jgi:hypothetical protein